MKNIFFKLVVVKVVKPEELMEVKVANVSSENIYNFLVEMVTEDHNLNV